MLELWTFLVIEGILRLFRFGTGLGFSVYAPTLPYLWGIPPVHIPRVRAPKGTQGYPG